MITINHKKWSIRGIESIFFDKDGTIIDSHLYWGEIVKRRAREIMKNFNLHSKIEYSYLCKIMGFSLAKEKLNRDGPTGLFDRSFIINIVVSKLRNLKIETTFEEIDNIFKKVHNDFLNEIDKYTKVIPEVYDFIFKLKEKDVKLALITSDSIKNTDIILKHIGMENLFDIVIGKENCSEPKVSGKPALFALEKLKMNAYNTVCIGDAPMDKTMADNANILKTILVATGQITYNYLKRISKYSTKSLGELKIE
ncbi:MAG TPA: HAD family hydrolase [Spirochaetota bacterium]|nr:HAD family hydrolase [Spirochaetota bacterium]HOL56051.1 HAD family hydrolase [Spirochaetota bacterium]HPP03197.1 HAD family hydrolase [Spirochaetota bacterium]